MILELTRGSGKGQNLVSHPTFERNKERGLEKSSIPDTKPQKGKFILPFQNHSVLLLTKQVKLYDIHLIF